MALALQTFPTVKDANAALKAAGTRYLGGGTLVVRAANEGDISVFSLVRSTDTALSAIEITAGKARIGASVTMARLASRPAMKSSMGISPSAVPTVASSASSATAKSP